MTTNSLRLSLSGKITLAQFAKSMSLFQAYLDALVDATIPGRTVTWYIDELQAGTADVSVTVRGESIDGTTVERVTVAAASPNQGGGPLL